MQVCNTRSTQETSIPRNISNLEKNILIPLATAIFNNNSETFAKFSVVTLEEIGIFLRPISSRRMTCLFTVALQAIRPEFSQLIFNQLEKANLLGQLVQQRDRAGWTPVHHAAMRNVMLYKRMKRVPEAAVLMTPISTSPSTLRKILRLSHNCIADSNYSIYVRLPEESEDSLLASADVIQIPGLFQNPPRHFSPLCHMSTHTLHQFWWHSTEQCQPNSKTFKAYNAYLSRLNTGVESHIALRRVETDDAGNKMPSDVGLGVYARTDIKVGTVLGNYGGWVDVNEATTTPHTYCMEESENYICNGWNYRSMMSMINHGMPNAKYQGCLINGIDETLIVATTNIKAGEQICCDYGAEYVKSQKIFLELRPRAMQQFVRENPLPKFFVLLTKKVNNTLSKTEDIFFSQWLYIVQETPTRFLQLILNSIIPQTHIQALISADDNHPLSVFYEWADESLNEDTLELCVNFLLSTPHLGPQLVKQLTKSSYTAQELQMAVDNVNKLMNRVQALVI